MTRCKMLYSSMANIEFSKNVLKIKNSKRTMLSTIQKVVLSENQSVSENYKLLKRCWILASVAIRNWLIPEFNIWKKFFSQCLIFLLQTRFWEFVRVIKYQSNSYKKILLAKLSCVWLKMFTQTWCLNNLQN